MTSNASRLSAIDAFFVAYQQCSGVLMQLGAEVELKGRIERTRVEQMLRYLVRRWPPLGQRLRKGLFGLTWEGECRVSQMLKTAESRKALVEWRNRPLNPFVEPPLQLLWIADGDTNVFAFRAHHAVVDGEGFFAICAEALRALAGKESIAADSSDGNGLFPRVSVAEALKHLQRLREESQSKRSARLAVRSVAPGDISIVERDLDKDEFRGLQRRATELNVAAGWLCASAWMKAIHAWNLARGIDSPVISLEVPVSLRRRRDTHVSIGNRISPLTLLGDATQTLEALAVDLKQQMSKAIRHRVHLALPVVSSSAKFLPWSLVRSLAADPRLTGVATSHFVWFEQSQTIHDEVLQLSGGALEMVDERIYTPVCLHMGAALSVLAWPERAQIFLTHRLTALSTTEADELADLVVQELGQKYLSRTQVAV
jgi:hypothetical protein